MIDELVELRRTLTALGLVTWTDSPFGGLKVQATSDVTAALIRDVASQYDRSVYPTDEHNVFVI